MRPDYIQEILGFSKWNFSQQITIVFQWIFSRLPVDYRAEKGRESQVAEVHIPDQNLVVCFAIIFEMV